MTYLERDLPDQVDGLMTMTMADTVGGEIRFI